MNFDRLTRKQEAPNTGKNGKKMDRVSVLVFDIEYPYERAFLLQRRDQKVFFQIIRLINSEISPLPPKTFFSRK